MLLPTQAGLTGNFFASGVALFDRTNVDTKINLQRQRQDDDLWALQYLAYNHLLNHRCSAPLVGQR